MSTSIQSGKQLVKFVSPATDTFFSTLKARVDNYFVSNNISKYANTRMYIKTVAMISMYFVPLLMMYFGVFAQYPVLFYAAWLVMGAGIVGIGCSVMHDSNHGAYSSSKKVNDLLGGLLSYIGGYTPNWKIQHNILHHAYTNLDGLDEDIEAGFLLRMSPHKPWLRMHRYQHIYAVFVYAIMNLFWVTVKDYRKIIHYNREDLLKKQKLTVRKAIVELTLLKVLYIGYILVLPVLLSGLPWYHVLFGFVGMHVVAGVGLAAIFQPAHVMESSHFPEPVNGKVIENNWAAHQVENTCNFAPDNLVLSWFIGGLNYQIEHHLFPHVCHVHYPALSRIVRQTAEEHGIKYNVIPSFRKAFGMHLQMLRLLGQPPGQR